MLKLGKMVHPNILRYCEMVISLKLACQQKAPIVKLYKREQKTDFWKRLKAHRFWLNKPVVQSRETSGKCTEIHLHQWWGKDTHSPWKIMGPLGVNKTGSFWSGFFSRGLPAQLVTPKRDIASDTRTWMKSSHK